MASVMKHQNVGDDIERQGTLAGDIEYLVRRPIVWKDEPSCGVPRRYGRNFKVVYPGGLEAQYP